MAHSGRQLPHSKPHVVVIFGRTGVGVSSLVNLIVGHPVSHENPDARPSTQEVRAHSPVTLAGSDKQFRLYEVPGFQDKLPDETIFNAMRQIDEKEGIDLFVYCLRSQQNTVIPRVGLRIRERIVGEDVPIIAVVTEMERFEAEGNVEDWWDTPLARGGTNGGEVKRVCFGGLGTFAAHACVTTLPRKDVDLHPALRKRRERSEERVRKLIIEQCARDKRRGV